MKEDEDDLELGFIIKEHQRYSLAKEDEGIRMDVQIAEMAADNTKIK